MALADEFELQRLYLALESRRFGDRLSIRLELPEALAGAPVPPLLLQPLVENAVKHGVAGASRPVEVAVTARVEAGALVLEVTDTGDAPPRRDGCGVGLENIRERLHLRHGGRGELQAGARREGGFTACIRLPLEPAHG